LDNLTHSLFALTLAHTPLRRAGRGTTLALVIASNAPDGDIVAALTGGRAAYLAAHRGISHGPLGVVAATFATAALVSGTMRWLCRRDASAGPRGRSASACASFLSLAGIAFVAAIGHVLMDLPTPYGTRLLSPFEHSWYALDWMPIIDVYLLGIFAAGLFLVRLRPASRTGIAATVLALMAANYGLRAELHGAALRRTVADGESIAGTLSVWPDTPSPKLPTDHPCPSPTCAVTTAAIPTFGSPFRWRIIREFSNGYRPSDLDLLAKTERQLGWLPHDDGPMVDAAREAPVARTFLAFSRFPAARITRLGRDTVVDLRDARFLDVPLSTRSEEFRPGGLFMVFVRLDPRGTIAEDRFVN
jgi:membrane-bound metal-dependent hydrolase YbcI (DUF457 family)